MLKIGISACFFHEDPQRAIFKGMTLQYIEQNVAHWLMQRDVLAFMVPSPDGRTRRPGSQRDASTRTPTSSTALVLMGGSDVCPETYGETALQPAWNGDRIRDDYEIALLRAFVAQRKPVLGLCRGAQIDQRRAGRHAVPGHRDAASGRAATTATGRSTRRTATRRRSSPDSGLARLYPGKTARQDQLGPSPGGQGPRPRARRRSLVGARPHGRGHSLARVPAICSACSGIRNSIAPGDPLVHRRHADARRIPRRRDAPQGGGLRALGSTTMKITNPATGAVITEVAADNLTAVRAQIRARPRGPAEVGGRADQQAPRDHRGVSRAHRRRCARRWRAR